MLEKGRDMCTEVCSVCKQDINKKKFVIMDVHGFPGFFSGDINNFEEVEATNPIEAATKYLAQHGLSLNLKLQGSKNNIHWICDGDHTEKVALYVVEQQNPFSSEGNFFLGD